MSNSTTLFFTIGLAIWAFITLVLYLFATRKKGPSDGSATSELLEEGPRPAPKRAYSAADEKKNALADRLVHAGLYSRNSSTFYYTSQLVLASVPMFAGAGLVALGFIGWKGAAAGGVITAGLSWITPSIWLDRRIKSRQQDIRRALPDALDILVISLEAGMSLPASLVRISKEMSGTYPLLATELTIVQREIQMGNNIGTALKSFADRFGLDELRSLASVVMQAERYGASVVQALRIHAETLRTKRLQMAQEKAQTATVKLLIPTVLFIFPAVFVVILGPAAFRLMETLMSKKGI